MSFIAIRPKSWNELIGQDRAVRTLHALLGHPDSLTRGYIFHGPSAVGKTSSAYLFARALMCMGEDPLGCGECPSCLTASESLMVNQSLQEHPASKEIDATFYSGADQARALIETLDAEPVLGARRVVIVDEAHRLSDAAWDVFLRPLEEPGLDVMFLFITSDPSAIPGTIKSRCSEIPFSKLSVDDLTGMLMSLADQRDIAYTLGGLIAIARWAAGRPRDANKALGLVAAVGEVTEETVDSVLTFEARTISVELLKLIGAGDLKPAFAKGDELAQRIGPVRTIETVFSCYADAYFGTPSLTGTYARLPHMTQFFLKWTNCSHLPADIVPLFIAELSEMRANVYGTPEIESAARAVVAAAPAQPTQTTAARPKQSLSLDELRQLVEN